MAKWSSRGYHLTKPDYVSPIPVLTRPDVEQQYVRTKPNGQGSSAVWEVLQRFGGRSSGSSRQASRIASVSLFAGGNCSINSAERINWRTVKWQGYGTHIRLLGPHSWNFPFPKIFLCQMIKRNSKSFLLQILDGFLCVSEEVLLFLFYLC